MIKKMKKIISLSFVLCFLTMILPAQHAKEGHFGFSKKITATAFGLALDIIGNPENLEEIISTEFKKNTAKKPKGFKDRLQLVEAANFARVSPSTLDYFYRIEAVKNKNQSYTRLIVFMSAGNFNFLNVEKYPNEIAAMNRWMSEIAYKLRSYEIKLAANTQEALIKDAEKELNKLKKEQEDLQKIQRETLKALEENTQAQANYVEKLRQEQTKLARIQLVLNQMN